MHECQLSTIQIAVFSIFYKFCFQKAIAVIHEQRRIKTRVSGETGALLVYSCLITYKRLVRDIK